MSEEYKNASALIAEQINIANAAIREAQKISDASGVEFSMEIAYGMGGWYDPKGGDYNEAGWQPSSMSC